jgi:2-oxoglutarate dehydrogenase E2 component (dihydrolipoamide succinyltransferase)
MTTKVTMPQLGESVVEGTIGKWLVRVGDRVEKDQGLVEVLTDKADTEIPAPVGGVVTSLNAGVDDVLPVGAVLCEIEAAPAPAPKAAVLPPAAPPVGVAQIPAALPMPSSSGRPSAFKVPPYTPAPGDQVVPFSRRRRIIADHMVYSKQTSPDVVTFAECDLHATSRLREKFKVAQYKKEGVSLTFLSFTLAATARALREFPELNARVLDDAYVKLRDVNLGIAVDTPEGLVVPVIRNADELTVRGLARAVDRHRRARARRQAHPDDLAGKTFSVTNPGLKGNLVGGAIISQPNVGILRLGTIKKRVVVVERDDQDLMAIHPVMYMALTYDHRIVDGVHANGFLYRISEILEQGDFEM